MKQDIRPLDRAHGPLRLHAPWFLDIAEHDTPGELRLELGDGAHAVSIAATPEVWYELLEAMTTHVMAAQLADGDGTAPSWPPLAELGP